MNHACDIRLIDEKVLCQHRRLNSKQRNVDRVPARKKKRERRWQMKVKFGRKDTDTQKQPMLTFGADQESFIGGSSCILESLCSFCDKKGFSQSNWYRLVKIASTSQIRYTHCSVHEPATELCGRKQPVAVHHSRSCDMHELGKVKWRGQ